MRYVVGLDEAGYGPNLGPLVQVAVACRVPDEECLWRRLSGTVCRANGEANNRVVIDDSKRVHALADGLQQLEAGATALWDEPPRQINALLQRAAIDPSAADVESEPWFRAQALPAFAAAERCASDSRRLGAACRAEGVELGPIRCLVTPASRFNQLLQEFDSKGAILARGVAAILRDLSERLPGNDPITFFIDKQGGRHYYAAMIQSAFPDGWVQIEREWAAESRYRVEGLTREIRLTFQPRAESASLPVAAASMTAKYLREFFMSQFNAYWRQHVPDIEPTAGYPGDALRFYQRIEPHLHRVGLAPDSVWRRR